MINLNGKLRIIEKSILKFRSDDMGNKFLNNIPWLTKEKKEKFKKLKGSANSEVDLNKMRDELKDPHKEIKIMNKNEMIKITENITKDFDLLYGGVKLAILLKDDFEFDNDTYTLLFASKALDDLSPLEATTEVVRFFRERNENILRKISSIIVMHTSNEHDYICNQFKDREYIEIIQEGDNMKAFRQCSDCRWNKIGHYCGKQMTFNGLECINFDKKK